MSNVQINDLNKIVKEVKEIEKTQFGYSSKFLVSDDELLVRKFSNKYINTPLLKGSFSKCRANGLITNHDAAEYNALFWRCCGTIIGSFFLSLYITSVRIPKIEYLNKNRKMFLITSAGSICVASVFSLIKFYSFKSQMDRKYTPIWMKSTGNLK